MYIGVRQLTGHVSNLTESAGFSQAGLVLAWRRRGGSPRTESLVEGVGGDVGWVGDILKQRIEVQARAAPHGYFMLLRTVQREKCVFRDTPRYLRDLELTHTSVYMNY